MIEKNELRDAVAFAMERARDMVDGFGLVGFGVAQLFDGDGKTKLLVPFHNIVTTPGDEYYAKMAIALVQPQNNAQPTKAVAMKLGFGTTAASKSGAGSGLVSYITGSNVAFDATFPSAAAVGGDGGWNANYKSTWAAGIATNSAITEVVIANVNDNATSTGAAVYARAVFTAINKTASDSLAITWTHKFLGA